MLGYLICVPNGPHMNSLDEGLGLDSGASSWALQPGFHEFLTVGLLSPGLLLNGGRRGTILSTLHESTVEECHAGKQTSSEISGTVSASQVLPYICSSSGQSQTTTHLSSRKFEVGNVGQTDQKEGEIARLGAPSNTVVSHIENAATNECTTEEHASWFDVDSFQPTEMGEPSADQAEETDLTSVPWLNDPQHKKDGILREEQS